MDNENHFPPGSEGAIAQEAEEAAKAEAEAKAQAEAEAAEKSKAEAEETAKAEDAAKAEAEAKAKAEAEAQQKDKINKRSIYDDLKEERNDRKGWQQVAISALKAQGHELTGSETIDQLSDLLANKANAGTPSEKSDADEDLKAFAEAEGLSVDGLKKLTEFLSKRVGNQPIPEDVQKTLSDINAWKQAQESTQRREQEDREVLAAAPKVKEQLKELGFEVHVDAELATVMNEIVRLSHTPEFHDKEVGYIVWSKRADLAKLVSPKKPSFESGDTPGGDGAPETEIDLSEGKATPLQAQKALESRGSRAGYEIRKAQ